MIIDDGLGQCLAEEIFDLIRDGRIKHITIAFWQIDAGAASIKCYERRER